MIHEGDILQIPCMESYDDGHGGSHAVMRRWTVVQVCEHFVLCESGHERECFTFGELIQLGYMKQDEVHEVMRAERCRCWSPFKAGDNYKRKYDDTEVEE